MDAAKLEELTHRAVTAAPALVAVVRDVLQGIDQGGVATEVDKPEELAAYMGTLAGVLDALMLSHATFTGRRHGQDRETALLLLFSDVRAKARKAALR